jgi:hypothetical protein
LLEQPEERVAGNQAVRLRDHRRVQSHFPELPDAVATALGDDPAKCLAMTVFGDGLRTFNA